MNLTLRAHNESSKPQFLHSNRIDLAPARLRYKARQGIAPTDNFMIPENEIKILENLDRLRGLAPKREQFQTDEQYAEASSGFVHRIGPSIRHGESLLKRVREKNQNGGGGSENIT